MSYQFAKKIYFLKEDFSHAINYYERRTENLSNAEIADAKFEKAYCYFNLKQFAEAKPLFDEDTPVA